MRPLRERLSTIAKVPVSREASVWFWFIFLALVTMGPVVTHFSQYLYGLGGDNVPGVYSMWWIRYALRHNVPLTRNFFRHYPLGISFATGLRPAPMSLTIYALLPFFNEVAAHNIVFLLYLTFSGLNMYWLVRYLSGHRLAAVVAGSVYMWAPAHLEEAWAHLSWSPMWIPLFFLALFAYSDQPSWKRAALAGVLLGFVLADNPYYGYLVALVSPLFACVYVLYHAISGTMNWRLVAQGARHVALVGAIALLWSAIVYFASLKPALAAAAPTFTSQVSGGRQPIWMFMGGAYPWDYLTPPRSHSLLGWINGHVFDYTTSLDVQFPVTHFEGIPAGWLSWGGPAQNYLGLTNLALAVVGLWAWRKMTPLMAGRDIGLLFYLAVLLVVPWISGKPALPAGLIIQVMLQKDLPILDYLVFISPSYWLYDLFPLIRIYARMGILAVQGAIALGGFGLATLLRRTQKRWQYALLAGGVFMVGMFEYLTFPPKYVDVSGVDARYALVLADEQGEYALVDDFPISAVENRSLSITPQEVEIWIDSSLSSSGDQRYYQRPLLDPIWWRYIAQADGFDATPVLSGLNVRYIVTPREGGGQLEGLVSSGHLRLVGTTTDSNVYAVQADPAPVMVYAQSNPLTAGIWQSQTAWTWSQQDMSLYILTDVQAELCLEAEAASQPPGLPFSPAFVGDAEQAGLSVTYEAGDLLVRLTLPTAGLYAISLTPTTDEVGSLLLDDIRFYECDRLP